MATIEFCKKTGKAEDTKSKKCKVSSLFAILTKGGETCTFCVIRGE